MSRSSSDRASSDQLLDRAGWTPSVFLLIAGCSDFGISGHTMQSSNWGDSGELFEDDFDTGWRPHPVELCDGLDNDSDGLVDEGFPDADVDGIADCIDDTCLPVSSSPDPAPADSDCEAEQLEAPDSFDLVERWSWNTTSGEDEVGGRVFSAPVVVSLTDDNGDGSVDTDDIPDIVFSHGRSRSPVSPGIITALSGDGTGEHWSYLDGVVGDASSIAAGDLDGDGVPEVIVHSYYNRPLNAVTALSAAGEFLWTHEFLDASARIGGVGDCGHLWEGSVAVADLDGDGFGEVLVCDQVIDQFGQPTAVLSPIGEDTGPWPTAVDLDLDGKAEIILGRGVFDNDGHLQWRHEASDMSQPESAYDYVASISADVDSDGVPEVFWFGEREVSLTDNTGETLWTLDEPALSDEGIHGIGLGHSLSALGPVFEGGELGFVLRDTVGTLAAIDMQGGIRCVIPSPAFEDEQHPPSAEAIVLYQPIPTSRALGLVSDWDAEHGAIIDFQTCGPVGVVPLSSHGGGGSAGPAVSGLVAQGPVIVDVDLDGQPELVVGLDGYGTDTRQGIVVYETSDSWAPSRPYWNQNQYGLGNINSDGSLATPHEATLGRVPSWRMQGWRGDWPSLGDLLVLGVDTCFECEGDLLSIDVHLGNGGSATVLPLVPVSVYEVTASGDTAWVTTEYFDRALEAGEAAILSTSIPVERWPLDSDLLIVVDDESGGVGRRDECREANNSWLVERHPCDGLR